MVTSCLYLSLDFGTMVNIVTTGLTVLYGLLRLILLMKILLTVSTVIIQLVDPVFMWKTVFMHFQYVEYLKNKAFRSILMEFYIL